MYNQFPTNDSSGMSLVEETSELFVFMCPSPLD